MLPSLLGLTFEDIYFTAMASTTSRLEETESILRLSRESRVERGALEQDPDAVKQELLVTSNCNCLESSLVTFYNRQRRSLSRA